MRIHGSGWNANTGVHLSGKSPRSGVLLHSLVWFGLDAADREIAVAHRFFQEAMKPVQRTLDRCTSELSGAETQDAGYTACDLARDDQERPLRQRPVRQRKYAEL